MDRQPARAPRQGGPSAPRAEVPPRSAPPLGQVQGAAPPPAPALRTDLRARRLAAGLSQQALAERAGVTRQTVAGIEAGRYGPGMEVGLRLARALACRADDLFSLDPDAEPAPEVVGAGAARRPAGAATRVALATIRGRPVARPLRGLGAMRWPAAAADGVLTAEGTLRRIGGAAGAGAVFLAGCDPALGLLGAHVSRTGRVEAFWWQAGNEQAAAELRRGEVHAAALHGAPGATPRAEGGLVAFRLASWRMGWLVRRGNPAGFHGAADLARGRIRLANREAGSGARALLDRLLAGAGMPAAEIAGYGAALPGHAAVADAVALGLADAGLAIEAAGSGLGLDFIPVATEHCDLWVRGEDLARDKGIQALIETLQSGWFRADLSAFGPYDTEDTGDRIA